MKNITLVAACGEKNRVIGNYGEIPWKVDGEQKRFKDLTKDSIVIMGRKTYASIGRPLPKRINIVLTRDASEYTDMDNLKFVESVDGALDFCETIDKSIFVIGGEEIYRLFLPYVSEAYISFIEGDFEGNAYLPELPDSFEEISSEYVESNINYTVKHFKKGEIIMSGKVIEVGEDELKAEIRKGAPVVVKIWKNNCPPCMHMRDVAAEVAKDLSIDIFSINAENNLDYVANELKVKQAPTIIYFNEGKSVKRISGYVSENELIGFLK